MRDLHDVDLFLSKFFFSQYFEPMARRAGLC
jgi:hypothetical protein